MRLLTSGAVLDAASKLSDPFVPDGVTVPALCSITIAMIVGVESATLKANAISILGFGMIERLDGTSSIELRLGGRADLVPTSIRSPTC